MSRAENRETMYAPPSASTNQASCRFHAPATNALRTLSSTWPAE
jgi:hypothetical protein